MILVGDLLIHDGTPDTAVEPSENRFQFKEHKYSASDLTTFTAFQLKLSYERN